MKKYQIWGIALVWLLSAFGFAIAETTEPATITAEVFMTELPDNGIATIVRDETCSENNSCTIVVSCDQDPNVEDCYTEPVDSKDHTSTKNDSLMER